MLISYMRSKNAEGLKPQVRTINEPCSFLGIIYPYLVLPTMVLSCREDLKRHKYNQQYSLQMYFSEEEYMNRVSEYVQCCEIPDC